MVPHQYEPPSKKKVSASEKSAKSSVIRPVGSETYSFRQLGNNRDSLVVVVDLDHGSIEFQQSFIESVDTLCDSFEQ